jgi:hypothetical protein
MKNIARLEDLYTSSTNSGAAGGEGQAVLRVMRPTYHCVKIVCEHGWTELFLLERSERRLELVTETGGTVCLVVWHARILSREQGIL